MLKASSIDSLYSLLKASLNESEKIEVYNQLSNQIYDNADSSLFYAQKALELSKKINHPQHIINSLLSLSNYYQDVGDFNQSLELLFSAETIADSINHVELQGKIFNNLGNVYRNIGDWDKANDFYTRAIKIYKQNQNELELGKTYNNKALVLVKQENLDEAISYYNQSIEIVSKFDDKKALANGYSNLGIAYYFKGNLDKTIYYFLKSLAIERELGDLFGVAISLSNIGELYFEQGQYAKAIDFLMQSIEMAKKVDAKDLLKHTYNISSQTFSKLKKYDSAYEYHLLYTNLKDSINDIEKSKHAMELEKKFNTSEKEKKILELEQQKSLQEIEIIQKKQTQNALLAGVVIVVLLSMIFYVRYRSKKKANEILQIQRNEIAQKNKEITDSITYAKRIQGAILPSSKSIKENLPDSFVYYQPKDIVAGDFYWFEKHNDKLLFAVADCTGHGVPGAMVSVICNNGLNRAVREYGLTKPSEILDKTREIILQEFSKSEDDVKDGMDIALCKLEQKDNHWELQFAGANNPLWLIKKDTQEIIEYKGDKQPIGRSDEIEKFTNHSIILEEGDSIYIFSDGYVDQFGGQKGKKLKKSNLKKIVQSFQKETMDKQGFILSTKFNEWKGKLEQVDDVCFVGVRI